MDELDPHIFFGIQKTHYAEKLRYMPKPAMVVEISLSGAGPPSVLSTKMSPDELDVWFVKQMAADRLGTTSPGLRLILGGSPDADGPAFPPSRIPRMPPVPQGGDKTWPSNYDAINLPWTIPFSRAHFDIIIERFGLPQSTRWLCQTDTQHLQTYRMRPPVLSAGGRRYTTGLTARIIQVMDLALSLSHDPSTGVTTALLLGQSKRQADFLRAQVERLARLARHPALLPTLLLSNLRTVLGEQVDEQCRQLYAIEADHLKGPLLYSIWNLNLTSRMVVVARLCGAWACYLEKLIEDAQRLREFVAQVSAVSGGSDEAATATKRGGSTGDSAELSELEEIGLILDERLDFILHKARNTLSSGRFVRDRSMASIPAVSNYIGYGISNRMGHMRTDDVLWLKAVVVLVMMFLPGIFLTTFFSTSFINSAGPPQWAFWIIAVPITIGIWVLWMTWKKWKLPSWLKTWPTINMPEWMGEWKRRLRRRVGFRDTDSITSSSSSEAGQ